MNNNGEQRRALMVTNQHAIETTRAQLMNSGGRVTLHKYVRSDRVSNDAGALVGFAHIFKCTETGTERRWGFDGPRDSNTP